MIYPYKKDYCALEDYELRCEKCTGDGSPWFNDFINVQLSPPAPPKNVTCFPTVIKWKEMRERCPYNVTNINGQLSCPPPLNVSAGFFHEMAKKANSGLIQVGEALAPAIPLVSVMLNR